MSTQPPRPRIPGGGSVTLRLWKAVRVSIAIDRVVNRLPRNPALPMRTVEVHTLHAGPGTVVVRPGSVGMGFADQPVNAVAVHPGSVSR